MKWILILTSMVPMLFAADTPGYPGYWSTIIKTCGECRSPSKDKNSDYWHLLAQNNIASDNAKQKKDLPYVWYMDLNPNNSQACSQAANYCKPPVGKWNI